MQAEETEAVEKDSRTEHIREAQQDLISALIKMDILPRIRYLLEVVFHCCHATDESVGSTTRASTAAYASDLGADRKAQPQQVP